jgi:ferredoxin
MILQNRFPKPDFESGYQYPNIEYLVPDESLWTVIDLSVLVVMMGILAWAALRKRSREPVLWVSIFSVAYFGFFRKGCVCSIGSIQNVALALVDSDYIIPFSVVLFFVLPLLFAFFFGRVFCAGACPFGALQELLNIKNIRISKPITGVLGLMPWIYLIFALLFAVTGSRFIICKLDPFVGIFRLGGDITMIAIGIALLVAAIFTGRPFCRFFCPYGALLSLFARVSIWKVKIPPATCINCELCHNACPLDAIKPPYENKVNENRLRGVKRIVNYFIILPVLIVVGALITRSLSHELSLQNKTVRLYEYIRQQETSPTDVMPVELETFYGQGGTDEQISSEYEAVQSEFRMYSTVAGALLGLVIGMMLISLSTKRARKEYEIDHSACVACGRCFEYCPQKKTG